jgi:GNAT superfamily N-acetyltransferase
VYYVERIDANQWAEFARLIPRGWNTSAKGVADELLFGARLFGEPIGAATVKPSPHDRSVAVLSSCRVVPGQRRAGVGTRLIRCLEEEARRRGFERLDAWFMEDDPRAPSMTALLRHCGWKEPEPSAYFCSSTHVLLSTAPWMDLHIPPELERFHWAQLTAQDRATIKAWLEDGRLPRSLDPLIYDPSQPMSKGSLGLRKNGELAAWCTVVYNSPSQACTQSFFVNPALGQPWLAIALLVESIRLTPDCEYQFHVSFERKGMVRFVDRRMRPYLTSVRRALCSRRFPGRTV